MKKKILITGGSGTLGRIFIKKYYNEFEFYNYSRNEKWQYELKKDFPKINNIIGSVEDKYTLNKAYNRVNPNIVIHAAAIKHVDIAENNSIECCKINILGSINVIEASIINNIPITIGISTDKACNSSSIYGQSKYLMEKCFVEANSNKIKFACCRFANIPFSNGSVIPFWLNLKEKNKSLKLTSPDMNRLFLSRKECVELVKKSIELCEKINGGFILSKKMKSVNMLDLAKHISNDIEIVGLRPGEKLNESLISIQELENSFLIEDDYIMIKKENNIPGNKLKKELNSLNSEKMNIDDIKRLLEEDE